MKPTHCPTCNTDVITGLTNGDDIKWSCINNHRWTTQEEHTKPRQRTLFELFTPKQLHAVQKENERLLKAKSNTRR